MSQNRVEIYTWATCPFCQRTKALFDSKGISYTEYAIDGDEDARAKMSQRAHGRRTVPQVFVDTDQHLGGCDDVHALDAAGKLDEILGL